MIRWGRLILVSIQFLTRIPFRIKGEISERDLGRSSAFFPVAGLIIGLIMLAVYRAALVVWPQQVAALLALAGLVVITGGLHLDGLMDTADGIMSGKSREKMLDIMKDSRVGAMGVIAGFFILALKLLGLGFLAPANVYRVLIIFAVTSRCSMTWALACFPYARAGTGTGRPFAENVTAKEGVIATVIALGIVGAMAGYTGLILAATGGACGLAAAAYASRKLGGLTGDTYGAVNEITETAVILVALAFERQDWLSWML